MEASPNILSRPLAGISHGLLSVQSDATLCRLAKRANPTAYETLYGRYRKPLFGFVCQMLGGATAAAQAEDLVQETFTAAFKAIPTHRGELNFKPWLYTIARNRTIDHLRGRREFPSDLTEVGIDESIGTTDAAEQRAELQWLVGAFGALPERQREALLMRELGGLSHGEIASALETTPAAAKVLVARGREAVRTSAGLAGVRPIKRKRHMAAVIPVLPLMDSWASVAQAAGLSSAAGSAGVATVASGTVAGGSGLLGWIGATSAGKIAAGISVTAVVATGAGVHVSPTNAPHRSQSIAPAALATPGHKVSGKPITEDDSKPSGRRSGQSSDGGLAADDDRSVDRNDEISEDREAKEDGGGDRQRADGAESADSGGLEESTDSDDQPGQHEPASNEGDLTTSNLDFESGMPDQPDDD